MRYRFVGKTICALVFTTIMIIPGSIHVGAMTLDRNTTVYTTDTGKYYHLKENCGNSNSAHPTTLEKALSKGIKMCSTCAKDIGMDPNKAQALTVDQLPINTSGDVGESPSPEGTSDGNNSETNNNPTANSDNNSITSATNVTNPSGSVTRQGNATTTGSGSGIKELMTEKQRRNRFISKTNPARGTKPVTIPRPVNAGFYYADFATYNSYNSDNNLGGTPIYLLGTIMDIQPVKQVGSQYGLAVMVNDCDGYQWYMRCNCDQSKLALLKAELMGKAGNIFGTYAGYSGVTNRPMMDMTMVFEIPGNAVNMALYL